MPFSPFPRRRKPMVAIFGPGEPSRKESSATLKRPCERIVELSRFKNGEIFFVLFFPRGPNGKAEKPNLPQMRFDRGPLLLPLAECPLPPLSGSGRRRFFSTQCERGGAN